MIGLSIAAVGVALVVVALIVILGPWAAVVCGVVLTLVGLLVDFDPVKEPQRAKRD